MSSFSSPSSLSPPSFPPLASAYPNHNHLATESAEPSQLLSDADHALVQRQMEDVQASLSSLPPSHHSKHLLSRLLSAYERQLLSEREAAQWKQHCGKVRQRLRGLRAELDALQDELDDETGAEQQPPYANGKEEKQQPNGHHHQLQHPHQHHHQQQQQHPHRQHSSATGASLQSPSDHAADFAFNGFSDYSTLLAATEAKLEVERKQRHAQQQQQPLSLSLPAPAPAPVPAAATCSPHYHQQDHTLTEAGKQLVRAILTLASPSSRSLDLAQLQRLCERVGRAPAAAAAAGGGDDDGDVWWVWQSYASEGEDGEQGMGQAEMEQLYEQEWDVDEDANRLGLT